VVVRVVPAANGAWIDAIVETQSIADAYSPSAPGGVELTGGWPTISSGADRTNITTTLAARMATAPGGVAEPIYSLPALEEDGIGGGPAEPPWAHSQHPRLARAGYKVLEDYRNFYSCESLTCITAAFGAGALMANTGFDTTMQNAWQEGVRPTDVGTFFSDCKVIGEGKYALPIFGAAALTGVVLEGQPAGDIVGEWGSRSLRIFVVGAPPLYVLQMATGASRPGESSAGSKWHFWNDNNGVSGHAFVGAGAVVSRDVPDFALVVGVPARQIGWVSRQGEPLTLPIKGQGEALCSVSGERYVLRDGLCVLASEITA
jgi:hypothetical protein